MRFHPATVGGNRLASRCRNQYGPRFTDRNNTLLSNAKSDLPRRQSDDMWLIEMGTGQAIKTPEAFHPQRHQGTATSRTKWMYRIKRRSRTPDSEIAAQIPELCTYARHYTPKRISLCSRTITFVACAP